MRKFGKHFRDNKTFATSADSDQPAHPHERGQYNLHADCSIWWKNVSRYNITIPSNIAQLCITYFARTCECCPPNITFTRFDSECLGEVRKTPIFAVKIFLLLFFFFYPSCTVCTFRLKCR